MRIGEERRPREEKRLREEPKRRRPEKRRLRRKRGMTIPPIVDDNGNDLSQGEI